MAVNYIGPFLLTRELLPLLEVSALSWIVNISPGLSQTGKVDFGDPQREKGYKGMRAYVGSKLMLITYTLELSKRL